MLKGLKVAAFTALVAGSCPAFAQQAAESDPYKPGREIVADIGKIVTPNGIQETFELTLGGARQVVNVRGSDRDNPLLIFIHGGPNTRVSKRDWTWGCIALTDKEMERVYSMVKPGTPIFILP